MTRRPADRYIESLVAGRRPKGFVANPVDAELIRTAIMMRGAQHESAAPREEFVSQLHDELAAAQGSHGIETAAGRRRRGRAVLLSFAAAASLIAGTVAVTDSVDHSRSVPAIAGKGTGVHSAALVDFRGRIVGRINIYRGNPSWVFMNLVDPGQEGPVACELEGQGGRVLVTGAFELTGGEGQWARTIDVDPGGIRSARIVTSTGALLARATFGQDS